MNLRTKTIFIISGTYLLILLVFVLIAHKIFLQSYIDLEMKAFENNIQCIHYQIEHELDYLASLTNDWAAWDDTYTFMTDRNEEYLQSNLVDGTFEELELNFIIFLNQEEIIAYSKGYDLEGGKSTELPSHIEEYITNHKNEWFFPEEVEVVKGVVSGEDHPVLLAAFPILTSQDEGPALGTLIFGKQLTGELFSHLSSSVNSTVSIYPYPVAETAKLDPQEFEGMKYFIDNSDPLIAVYYSILEDINSNPAFVIRQESERHIYQQGLRSITELLVSISTTSLIALITGLLLLERGILHRLTAIDLFIKSYRKKGEEHDKIELNGKDELSQLTREIHNAFHNLTETQKSLRNHLEIEKLMVGISTKFINLPYEHIDQGIQEMLETIGNYSKADRSYIILLKENDSSQFDNTHEWCRAGVIPQKDTLQNVPVEPFHWWFNKMHAGKSICISRVSELPKSALAEKEFLEMQSIQSLVSVPLMVARKLIGFLGFHAVLDENLWDDQTILWMEIIGNIISNTIDRKRAETRLRLSQRYQYNLNKIIQSGIAKHNLHNSLRALSSKIKSLIDSDQAFIVIPHSNQLRIYQSGNEIISKGENNQTYRDLLGRTGKKFYIHNSSTNSSLKSSSNQSCLGEAFIAIPLEIQKQNFGIVVIAFDKPHIFSELEISICEQAGPQISLVIMKAQAFEDTQKYLEQLDALRATIANMTSERELSKLLHTILERAIRLLKADGGDFCIVDEKNHNLKVVASLNLDQDYFGTIIHFGEGAAGLAAEQQQIFMVDDYSCWEGRMETYEKAQIHAAMVSPMVIAGRLLGTVGIFNFDAKNKFTDDDKKLLTLFAQHAAIAMDNALLFEKIQEMARTDSLTGLLNRRAFMEIGEYEINRSLRLQDPLSVIMVDMDNFKEINDTYNHEVGDQILVKFVKHLVENIRKIDIIGRYGGDEFIIIMPATGPDVAVSACERLREKIESTQIKVNGIKFPLTASFGITSCRENPPTLTEMIHQADRALHQSKSTGKNRIAVFKS